MTTDSIKVLYVDDEEANLINFKFLFNNEFEVYTAASAMEGAELLKMKDFQIVISDQRMPVTTGIEFLAEVSQIQPDAVRILLTAYTEIQDIIDAINIGRVYQYITKPLDEHLVRDTLNKAAENWWLKKHNQQLITDLQEKNDEYEQLNEELRQSNDELFKANEKAEENEEHYMRLVQTAPIMLYDYVLNPDGTNKFLYVGPGCNEILELEAEEMISDSNSFWKKVHPDDLLRLQKEDATANKRGDYFVSEFRIRTKSGKIKWILAASRPNPTTNNEPAIWSGYIHDITEKIHFEQEIIAAKEKAEESDRLKTAFLQNMSHEIRTPLNAISGFSGMLNKPELSEEKRRSFVSIIQNSSKQLISIVTDILTISSLETKQEKANIDKVCINNIIVDLLAIFKQQAINQNISLYAKQQLNNKQSEIYTDKTKIIQILTNLLTNALKFTHEGFIEFGYTLVETQNIASQQQTQNIASQQQTQNIASLQQIQFYVKDSGIGINPDFHEKIFERFRQADKSTNKLYGGTGLGLAISKAFVELLGGKIWVHSELVKGSTFYFTVPYNPVNEIDKSIIPTKQNENFKTILVAEDEESNFLFIEELLIDMDLKLIHSKDGKETIDLFKANPNIDLILMDIKMPIMDGYEAAKIIKELKPDLPIVAQSAYGLEQERARYEDVFDDYLTKPIDEDDLKQMVMKYIDIKKE